MESLAGEEPLAISSISPLLAKGELQVPGGQHLRPARRAFRRPNQGRHEVWRAFSEALGEKAVFVTHAGLGAQAAKAFWLRQRMSDWLRQQPDDFFLGRRSETKTSCRLRLSDHRS